MRNIHLRSDQQNNIRDLLGDDDKVKDFVRQLNRLQRYEVQKKKSRLIHRYKLAKNNGEYKQIEKLKKLSRQIFDVLKKPKGDLKVRLENFGFSNEFEEEILNFYGATITILDQVKIKSGAKPKIEEHQITRCARVMMFFKVYYPNLKVSASSTAIFYKLMEIIVEDDPRQLIERTQRERIME